MGRGFMMSDCQALEMAPAAPAKTPVPCAFPAPNIAHQALASVPLPAAVPQDYRKSICMSAQPPLPRAEAKSESPAAKVEDDEKTRVTVWNPTTGKKLSGNAGVQKKNLAKYLRTHPDWVVWNENHRGALKRKRIDMELERARQEKIAIEEDHKMQQYKQARVTQSTLWVQLLAVCSEEFTQAEEEDYMNEICSPRIGYPSQSGASMTSPACMQSPASDMAFIPGGLTSPAVG